MTTCQRCGKGTNVTIMSMFSTATICMDCKEKERDRPDYKTAEAKDLREYAGRLRGKGMGPSADQVEKAADNIEREGKP